MVQSVVVSLKVRSREEWRSDAKQRAAARVIVGSLTVCAQLQDKECSMASVGACAEQPHRVEGLIQEQPHCVEGLVGGGG